MLRRSFESGTGAARVREGPRSYIQTTGALEEGAMDIRAWAMRMHFVPERKVFVGSYTMPRQCQRTYLALLTSDAYLLATTVSTLPCGTEVHFVADR